MMRTATVKKARLIEKHYGTSYYAATLFLPRPVREAVFVLYAFVRIPDEIVDNPRPGSDPAELLERWKNDWLTTYHTGNGSSDIMLAAREVFITYHIPVSLSEEFINAMISDLTVQRYADYPALKAYMRGSAEVVGLMLTHIFGYRDEQAFAYAAALGEAMQLTNFLRDINEDYVTRNRIYLPQADMTAHGVTEAMITHQAPTSEFIALMKFEIARARALYQEAAQGIPFLSPENRKAVVLAARFYEGILDAIERQHYDVFTRRARVSTWRKCSIILRTYVGN